MAREMCLGHFCSNRLLVISVLFHLLGFNSAQLSLDFYAKSCPRAFSIIQMAVHDAVSRDNRMGASLLRLHFHDCFVNGCDGSILLDDKAGFKGEKTAGANDKSVRGYEVIDTIKSQLEKACPDVVSCADIVAVAARDSVLALGGPIWRVQLGRRDSKTASYSAANTDLPSPSFDLKDLIASFSNKGFTAKEMVALSGSHTIGHARCATFRQRIHNDSDIDAAFAATVRSNCPSSDGGDDKLSPLDAGSPEAFDNHYFWNLAARRGLLHSDQQLFSGDGGPTDADVSNYRSNPAAFMRDFAAAMEKMSVLGVITGTAGEVRKNCRRVN